MRKWLVAFLSFFVSLIIFSDAHAEPSEVLDGMINKLRRGAINTFTGWIELPSQIVKGYNEGFMHDEKNKIVGVAFGIVDGVAHSLGRTLSGILEVIGFWAADPVDNSDAGIPFDADYAWEVGAPYDLFDPNFTEATINPIVNKFFRGAGNAIFGFIELPGQITRGIQEGAPHSGIVKGLWLWASREITGISDIITAPLPGSEDTVGAPFDDDWPWEVFIKDVKRRGRSQSLILK